MLLPLVLISYALKITGLSLENAGASSRSLVRDNDETERFEDLFFEYINSSSARNNRSAPPPEPVHTNPKIQGRPIINFNMNSQSHFEVLVSLIHWFSGKDLPYHARLPKFVEKILADAKRNGSDIYVNARYTYPRHDRYKILYENMKNYSINMGSHKTPDLTVFITVYSSIQTFQLAALNHWKDKEDLLLIVHNFTHDFSHSDLATFTSEAKNYLSGIESRGFTNFANWNNVLGLTPNSKSYVLPTYVPFERHKNVRRVPPTFCVQGTMDRRDFAQFNKALGMMKKKDCNFTIALAGHGKTPPEIKQWASRTRHERHLDDIGFGAFFLKCDYLLPLLSENTLQEYMSTKLSSSVTRSIGFNVPVIAWRHLRQLYPMLTGVFYNDTTQFRNLLDRACACPGNKHDCPY